MEEQITVSQLVREYFPNASDSECEYIIWEKTAFPLVGVEILCKQLKEFHEEMNGNLSKLEIFAIRKID